MEKVHCDTIYKGTTKSGILQVKDRWPEHVLTCLNARDAGGVKYPLHLGGTHGNSP